MLAPECEAEELGRGTKLQPPAPGLTTSAVSK
jgi:hypothetical protein